MRKVTTFGDTHSPVFLFLFCGGGRWSPAMIWSTGEGRAKKNSTSQEVWWLAKLSMRSLTKAYFSECLTFLKVSFNPAFSHNACKLSSETNGGGAEMIQVIEFKGQTRLNLLSFTHSRSIYLYSIKTLTTREDKYEEMMMSGWRERWRERGEGGGLFKFSQ